MDCDLGSIANITSCLLQGAVAAQRNASAFRAQQKDLSSFASAITMPTHKAGGVLAITCHLLVVLERKFVSMSLGRSWWRRLHNSRCTLSILEPPLAGLQCSFVSWIFHSLSVLIKNKLCIYPWLLQYVAWLAWVIWCTSLALRT